MCVRASCVRVRRKGMCACARAGGVAFTCSAPPNVPDTRRAGVISGGRPTAANGLRMACRQDRPCTGMHRGRHDGGAWSLHAKAVAGGRGRTHARSFVFPGDEFSVTQKKKKKGGGRGTSVPRSRWAARATLHLASQSRMRSRALRHGWQSQCAAGCVPTETYTPARSRRYCCLQLDRLALRVRHASGVPSRARQGHRLTAAPAVYHPPQTCRLMDASRQNPPARFGTSERARGAPPPCGLQGVAMARASQCVHFFCWGQQTTMFPMANPNGKP